MWSAPQLLRDWIRRREYTQNEAAEFLGFMPEELSMYLNGRRRPTLEKAVTIERLAGIPASAWVSTAVHSGSSTPSADSGKA